MIMHLLGLTGRRPMAASKMDGPEPAGPPLPLPEFVNWLIEADLTDRIDRRALVLFYGEFCLDTNSTPLTEGQLLRRMRRHGIKRYREPIGRRRWLYRIQFPIHTAEQTDQPSVPG